MRVKNARLVDDSFNAGQILSFESVRPLGNEEYDLVVRMSGNQIAEISGGTVVTKGEWLDINEYCEPEEIKNAFNDAVKRGMVEYA